MRVRDQRGFTLIEVLLVCVVGMIVFGATLSAFNAMYSSNRSAELQRDNVEEARVALDRAARQLRNLANPSGTNPTIVSASSRDFIFQTSEPAKTWLRYCLDTRPPASAAQARLWMAESSNATLPAGMTGTCGVWGAGVTARMVTQNVTNVADGMDRPIFTFACISGSPVSCPASASEYPKITMVGAQLYVDANAGDRVREMQVSTAVYLRNQNQAPTVSVSGPARLATRKVMLNGSGSSDPEGRTLAYHWYINNTNTPPPDPFPCATPPAADWDGPIFTKTFDSSVAIGSTYKAWLVVCDPGGLSDTSDPTDVTVPS